MPEGRPPTIKDVADRAGVSKSLVSLVMRGSAKVSEERRAAVVAAAAELGYRPNAVARSLVRQRSHVVGLMLSDIHNPYFAEVVDGVESAAALGGYRALFNTGSRRPAAEREAMETLLELRVDGLVLAGPVLAVRDIAAAARSVPLVLVARASRSVGFDSVTNDDRRGGALAVEHLVALGHERIAHISAGSGAGARSRRTGYERAMARAGLSSHIRVVSGSFTEEGGYEGMRRLLAGGERPTAVFVANDLAAIGALQAADDAGVAVPGDVSVVGYDNTALAALGRIDLTTIDQPGAELGAMAVELLFERIDGRVGDRHIVVTPSLVVRSTTGPPP